MLHLILFYVHNLSLKTQVYKLETCRAELSKGSLVVSLPVHAIATTNNITDTRESCKTVDFSMLENTNQARERLPTVCYGYW